MRQGRAGRQLKALGIHLCKQGVKSRQLSSRGGAGKQGGRQNSRTRTTAVVTIGEQRMGESAASSPAHAPWPTGRPEQEGELGRTLSGKGVRG